MKPLLQLLYQPFLHVDWLNYQILRMLSEKQRWPLRPGWTNDIELIRDSSFFYKVKSINWLDENLSLNDLDNRSVAIPVFYLTIKMFYTI